MSERPTREPVDGRPASRCEGDAGGTGSPPVRTAPEVRPQKQSLRRRTRRSQRAALHHGRFRTASAGRAPSVRTGCRRGPLTGSATTKRAGDVRQVDVAPPSEFHARVHGTGVQQRSTRLVNNLPDRSCIADTGPAWTRRPAVVALLASLAFDAHVRGQRLRAHRPVVPPGSFACPEQEPIAGAPEGVPLPTINAGEVLFGPLSTRSSARARAARCRRETPSRTCSGGRALTGGRTHD